MPFGRTAGYVTVYRYGVPPASPVRPPIINRELALGVMRQRVQLWNRLVELERAHQAEVNRVLQDAEPSLAQLAEAVEQAEEGKPRRQAERAYRQARRAVLARPEVRAHVQALERQEYQAARDLARESGLWWPNYEDVLASWQVARRRPGELRLHRAGQNGKLLARWQTGLPVPDALARRDRRFQLEVTGSKRHRQLALARLRIASDEEREPVWLELPVVLHRPLPEAGLIRQAAVTWHRVATAERWNVSVTVEVPEPGPSGRDGTATVSLHWKRVPGGLRVAVWTGSDGEQGELIVPEWWLSSMHHLEGLQSARDQQFNAVCAALRAWLEATPGAPPWLREATRGMGQWRSPGRLVAVHRRWTEQRFSGDEVGYQLLAEWVVKDRHLWQWQANLREKRLAYRRHLYRRFAAELVRRYGAIVVDRPALKRIAVSSKVPDAVQYYRHLAALSDLDLALRNAARREGVRYEVSQKGEGLPQVVADV